MKIKHGYLMKNVAGSNIVVNVTGNMDLNGMITLNDVGAFLWSEIEKGSDKAQLVKVLTDKYVVEKETAQKDVAFFIKKLENAGILE